MPEERARLEMKGSLCGREQCDGRITNATDILVLKDLWTGEADVAVRFCAKCLRALRDGRWMPSRQKDRVEWRVNEKQVHAVIMDALNRTLFRLPYTQWGREVDCPAAEGADAASRIDLVAIVHKNALGRMPHGVHAVEVKMSDDRDTARLARQVTNYMASADYTWVVRVDDKPEYHDERVGLLEYDLKADDFIIHREATRVVASNNRVIMRHVRQDLNTGLERLYALVGAKRP